MGVTKHTRVTSEKVKDAALATVDYGNATVTETKFSEHLEHGLGSAILGGTYTKFTTAFGAAPQVVATGYGSAVYLAKAPVAGSFALKQGATGTISANYVAWGTRV